MRLALLAGAAALLVALALVAQPAVAEPSSDTSSTATGPEPVATLVSELAPAVVVPPAASALPDTGGGGGVSHWPAIAGLGLALLGLALLQAGRSVRVRPSP